MFTQLMFAVVLASGQFPTEAPPPDRTLDPPNSPPATVQQTGSFEAPAWPSRGTQADPAIQPESGQSPLAAPSWGSIYSRALSSPEGGDQPSQPTPASGIGSRLGLTSEPAAAIRPVENQTPLMSVSSEGVESAATLLRSVLGGQGSRPLDGEGVTLATVLSKIPAAEPRKQATRAYWRLAQRTAAHQFCVEETDFLLRLAIPQAVHQQALLTSMQASAKADEARARLEALRAQYALSATKPNFADAALPLPADLPFVGVYETHFETFQSRGLTSEELTQIHATLPVLRDVIERQADAAYAAGAAVYELQQGYNTGQVPLDSLLQQFEQLRQQRRSFLDAVLEYNESIADYALAVASPNLPVDRVVGMLIEVPDGQRSVLASRREQGSIRRVSNEAEIGDR